MLIPATNGVVVAERTRLPGPAAPVFADFAIKDRSPFHELRGNQGFAPSHASLNVDQPLGAPSQVGHPCISHRVPILAPPRLALLHQAGHVGLDLDPPHLLPDGRAGASAPSAGE